MRSSLAAFATAAVLFATPTVSAQFVAVGGGCVAGGGAATAPAAVGGAPQIGNIGFGIGFTSPAGTAACFALFGVCEPPPLPDYSTIPAPCAAPCGRAVGLAVPPVLLGNLVPPNPTVFQIPIPNLTGLIGSKFCMQFLCFDTVGCSEVSQGAEITIQP